MREEFLEEIPLDAPPEEAKELRTEVMTLNVGPQHPSTHGVLHLQDLLPGGPGGGAPHRLPSHGL